MKNNKDLKKPFFANFLENQLSNEEKNSVQGGDIITLKTKDMLQTLKYPSDSEDGPGGPVTLPKYDLMQTMKYPSDNDETGGPILLPNDPITEL